MPRNTITYTQSKIGLAILPSGSSCQGRTRPHQCIHTTPPKTDRTNGPSSENRFRPINATGQTDCIQSEPHKTHQIVRPRAVKSKQAITKLPGRAYRVHTTGTYVPESYSKYAYIRKDIRSMESAHYNSTIRVPDTFTSISAFTFPVHASIETNKTVTSVSASTTQTNVNQTDRQSVGSQSRSDRKSEIKRLNKFIKTGDLNAVQHWARTVRKWTNEIESELHAINHGTKIIESLIGKLSTQQ